MNYVQNLDEDYGVFFLRRTSTLKNNNLEFPGEIIRFDGFQIACEYHGKNSQRR